MFSYAFAQRIPSKCGRPVYLDVTAALLAQKIQRILRQNPPIPQAAAIGSITPALFGQLGGGPVGVVGNRFHCMIGKFHRLIRGVGNAQHMQAILETHDT